MLLIIKMNKMYILLYVTLFILITLQQYRTAAANDDSPGSWNSITRSMSKEEIENLKKMAMPSYPDITDKNIKTATVNSDIQSGYGENKNKRKLSQRPATVARRKRLEKLEIKDHASYIAFREAEILRETKRRKNFTPEQRAAFNNRSKECMQKSRARLNLPGNEKLKEEAQRRSREHKRRYREKMKQKEKQN